MTTELLKDRKRRLVEPLTYSSSMGVVPVHIGFITDFASIPRVLWPLLPPDGSYAKAAVIHDYLYTYQAIGGRWITRKQADQVFLEAMEDSGVGFITRMTVYAGVRFGGWIAWGDPIPLDDNPTEEDDGE